MCLHTKQSTNCFVYNVNPNHRDPNATNQTSSLFDCLSVPFFGPFGENFHQSEDGFSTLILTNKIVSGKSETGDDNTMPHVLGNRPEKKERTKRNEHIEMQKGANFTINSFYTRA